MNSMRPVDDLGIGTQEFHFSCLIGVRIWEGKLRGKFAIVWLDFHIFCLKIRPPWWPIYRHPNFWDFLGEFDVAG